MQNLVTWNVRTDHYQNCTYEVVTLIYVMSVAFQMWLLGQILPLDVGEMMRGNKCSEQVQAVNQHYNMVHQM